jgi:hypothetical protein
MVKPDPKVTDALRHCGLLPGLLPHKRGLEGLAAQLEDRPNRIGKSELKALPGGHTFR